MNTPIRSTDLFRDLSAARLPTLARAWEVWTADPRHAKQGPEACLRFLLDAHLQARDHTKLEAFFRQAGLPSHFALATFEHGLRVGVDDLCMAHLRAMSWARAGQTVVITGPTLSGKTHLAAALGREAIAHGIRSTMVQAPAMLERLLDPDVSTVERKRHFKQLSRAELLIIDDFATEPAGDEETVQFRRLLDERTRRGLPLVVTSIHGPDEWDKAFAEVATREGIYARVLGGACHQVALRRRQRSNGSAHVTRVTNPARKPRKVKEAA
ncbi:ATP-binding protein [Luteibacter sp. UNCMF366Tsu5.1]|uniref:ATP-binding protein n=1 Tax=Luteibacter sp. UNCMF366Tsu5.1 TaxID=1502758 RepID=UPI0009089B53|nr:ATP-binding protein [Luteibacter sp. UNCMF366Tsu5.1]SFW28107.1 DNA replication protein DnaC [Luteibacter sp. UNCMF366Tsu5.1]